MGLSRGHYLYKLKCSVLNLSFSKYFNYSVENFLFTSISAWRLKASVGGGLSEPLQVV